jgi:PAS domain S-box-containing protein
LDGVAASLARALMATLSLELVYIRLAARASNGVVEQLACTGKLDAAQEAIAKRSLRDAAEWAGAEPPSTLPDPFSGRTLRVAVVRFGVGDDQGVLVAASHAAGFPSEEDRLLLSVGANQTAVVVRRRLAEEQEHEQRERLRVTLSSIGDAVIATNIEGRVTFMNAVAEKLTGWPQAEAGGKSIEEVLVAFDEHSGAALRLPVEGGGPRAVRALLRSRSGAEHAIDGSASPIRNSAGAAIGLVVVFRSVSGQRRAEQLRNTRLAVVQVLNRAASVQEAALGVLSAVCENLGWDAGFLWTADAQADTLTCRAGWQRPDVPMPHFVAACEGRTFRRGEGLPARVWTSGNPEWLDITAEDPGFPRIEAARKHGLRSGFACPVVIGERTIGAMEFFSVARKEPEADLLEMMATVASNVGQFMERKAAEDELRRNEEELSEFFENASVGLHWVGPDGTVLRANRAELEMLGYTREEYVGRPISDFHADEEVICDILDKLNAGRKLAEYPARLRCKDGSIKDVLIDSSVMWKDGRFVHTQCFTRDVTARMQAERALAAARSQLEAALEAGAIATWTWDIPQNRLHADRHLARLFNLPASEAAGGELDKYVKSIHPDDVQPVRAALERSIGSGEDYAADYRIMQPDGSVRWVSARGRTERDRTGRPVRMPGVLVDITERKKLEEELRLRVKQLAEADRRKDEFLATLAHELRNPLAPVRNSLEILKMARLDAKTVQQTRDIMERQVQHLVRLVDDLLDVSRVMRGKIDLRREPIELATVVARAVEMTQSLIEAQGHHLSLSLPGESLIVLADPVRLTQVIGNLLANSAKYTDANGHIWLSATIEGGTVVLSVRDDGIGIAPELLPHVFELFVQADHAPTRSTGGLGIGLTLVKNLVEMHGGAVEARSAGPGKGSEFVMRLPLLAHAGKGEKEAAHTDDRRLARDAPGLRILVVDDNRDAAQSLATLLRLRGHDVRVEHDGAAALGAIASCSPQLVFLDLGMPGMDGFEVARRIRAEPRLQGVVLAALTGWGQREDRRRTAEAGFDHHLVKPADPEAVMQLLDRLSVASA